MPNLMNSDDNMEEIGLPGAGTFKFSRVRPDKLGAAEYTVVSVVVDVSGSVINYADDLLKAIKSIVNACARSPRSENLLLRVVRFNTDLEEIHGFKELHSIDADREYTALKPDGGTALYDAADTAIQATLTYARDLYDADFAVNGAVYIITDGEDNSSVRRPAVIKTRLKEALRQEYMESLITVLVGVTNCAAINQNLESFKDDAGLSQYINIGEASPRKLARLADFVTQSISLQSQSLGIGDASQSVSF